MGARLKYTPCSFLFHNIFIKMNKKVNYAYQYLSRTETTTLPSVFDLHPMTDKLTKLRFAAHGREIMVLSVSLSPKISLSLYPHISHYNK